MLNCSSQANYISLQLCPQYKQIIKFQGYFYNTNFLYFPQNQYKREVLLDSSNNCNAFASEDFHWCQPFYSPLHLPSQAKRSLEIQATNHFPRQKKSCSGLFTGTITKLFIVAAASKGKRSFTTMDMFPGEIIKGLRGSNGNMWSPPKPLGTVFHLGVMEMRDA